MPVETQQTEQPMASPNNTPFVSTSHPNSRPDDPDSDVDEDAASVEEIQRVPYEEDKSSPFYRVYDMAEKFAATRVGQFAIERADRALRIVEDTAKWSLPQYKDDETKKLERPISWIPFLYLIVVLRCIRIAVSVAALMIGNAPVSPRDVVAFVQSRRRMLRAARRDGRKAMQISREEKAQKSSDQSERAGVASKIRKIFASAICRPGLHREPMRRFLVPRGDADTKHATDSGPSTSTPNTERPASKRPREDESMEESNNLTVLQMLERDATLPSDEDNDFVPEEEEGESTSSEDTSSDATSEADTQIHNNAQTKETEDAVAGEGAGTNANSKANGNHSSSGHNSTNENDENVAIYPQQNKQPVMPKPMVDIKKEPIASDEPQTPKENGGEPWEADVANRGAGEHQLLSVAAVDERRKSTPGHESAATLSLTAMLKPKTMAAFGNATAMAVNQTIESALPIDIPSHSQTDCRKTRRYRSPASSSRSSSSSSSSSASASPTSTISRKPAPISSAPTCTASRLVVGVRVRSRSRSRASSTRSTEQNDTSSDLDSFQSLEDVSLTTSDNLFEPTSTPTPQPSAPQPQRAQFSLAAAAATENETENDSDLYATVRANRNRSATKRTTDNLTSSADDDEFYSPVGSPEDNAAMEAQGSAQAGAHSTPLSADNQDATATTARPYDHNQKKHTLQQQQQHQNRYRNRNRR